MNNRLVRVTRRLIATTGLLAFLIVTTVRAEDAYTDVPLAQVPKLVRDAVMKKFPDAKPQSASKGLDGNKPFFDVFIKVKEQNVWVTCDQQGAILVIDREIAIKELPKPVADALSRKYAKATVRMVNEIIENNVSVYDIALTHNNKKLIAIFEASGRFVEELDDDEP